MKALQKTWFVAAALLAGSALVNASAIKLSGVLDDDLLGMGYVAGDPWEITIQFQEPLTPIPFGSFSFLDANYRIKLLADEWDSGLNQLAIDVGFIPAAMTEREWGMGSTWIDAPWGGYGFALWTYGVPITDENGLLVPGINLDQCLSAYGFIYDIEGNGGINRIQSYSVTVPEEGATLALVAFSLLLVSGLRRTSRC